MQIQLLTKESEFDKDKALMTQKIEHIESNLEAYKNNEASSVTEIQSLEATHVKQVKKLEDSHEKVVAELKALL